MTNTTSTPRRAQSHNSDPCGKDTESIPEEADPLVGDRDVRTGETGVEVKDADAVTYVDTDTGKITRLDPFDAVEGRTRPRIRGTNDLTTAGLPVETAGRVKRRFLRLLRALESVTIVKREGVTGKGKDEALLPLSA